MTTHADHISAVEDLERSPRPRGITEHRLTDYTPFPWSSVKPDFAVQCVDCGDDIHRHSSIIRRLSNGIYRCFECDRARARWLYTIKQAARRRPFMEGTR